MLPVAVIAEDAEAKFGLIEIALEPAIDELVESAKARFAEAVPVLILKLT